jgi:hypothetical protein
VDSGAVAALRVDNDDLVLHMDAAEKAEGFHGDIRVPLRTVTGVHAVDASGRRSRRS